MSGATAKGRPARVDIRLPVWAAEALAGDIDRVMSMEAIHSATFPLALHDFKELLAEAIREAKTQ